LYNSAIISATWIKIALRFAHYNVKMALIVLYQGKFMLFTRSSNNSSSNAINYSMKQGSNAARPSVHHTLTSFPVSSWGRSPFSQEVGDSAGSHRLKTPSSSSSDSQNRSQEPHRHSATDLQKMTQEQLHNPYKNLKHPARPPQQQAAKNQDDSKSGPKCPSSSNSQGHTQNPQKRSIADLLKMTPEQLYGFFKNLKHVTRRGPILTLGEVEDILKKAFGKVDPSPKLYRLMYTMQLQRELDWKEQLERILQEMASYRVQAPQVCNFLQDLDHPLQPLAPIPYTDEELLEKRVIEMLDSSGIKQTEAHKYSQAFLHPIRLPKEDKEKSDSKGLLQKPRDSFQRALTDPPSQLSPEDGKLRANQLQRQQAEKNQGDSDCSAKLERAALLGGFVPPEVSKLALKDNGKLLTEAEIKNVLNFRSDHKDGGGRYHRKKTHCRYDIYEGKGGERYAIYNRSGLGCDLYLTTEKQLKIAAERNSYCYLFTERKNLYYVRSHGRYTPVRIDDKRRFVRELNTIGKAHLSPAQIRELITNNGGHIHKCRYELSSGATSRVELAQNLRTGEWCILKTLLLGDSNKLFKNEAAVLKELNRLLGGGFAYPFRKKHSFKGALLMKYVQGSALGDLRARGDLPLLMIKGYLAGLMAEQEFMAKGFLHGDISPRNCIVDFSAPKPVANLIGCRAARCYIPEAERSEAISSDLPVFLRGTPAFMAPELTPAIEDDCYPGLYSQDSEVYAWGALAIYLGIVPEPSLRLRHALAICPNLTILALSWSMVDPDRTRRPLLRTVIAHFQRYCEDYAKDHPDEAAQVEHLLSEARRNRKPNGSEACLTREHPVSFAAAHPPASAAASAAYHASEFSPGEYVGRREAKAGPAVSVSATPAAESKNNDLSLGSSIYLDPECPDTQPVSVFGKLTSSEHNRLLAKSSRDASDNLALARHFRYTNEGDITGNRRLALDFYKQASSQLKERKMLKNGCEANIKQLEESLGIRPSVAVSSTCDSPFAFFPSSAASAPAPTAAASQPRRIAPGGLAH
jgi:hypothetical protein